MNIRLFNKDYWVRRFGEQREVKGYLTATHTDFAASLNVHPAGSDVMSALPEGERAVKRLEGHSDAVLIVADPDNNRKGDLLYYQGDWYECVSAQGWDHTILSHQNYQFTLVPNDAAHSTDTVNPPTGDPIQYNGGGNA